MSAHDALRSRAGLLAVSAAAVLWGTTGVAVRWIHDRTGMSAVPIGCYRLAIAALVLGLVFGPSAVRRTRAVWQRHRWALVLSGVGLGIYQALYFVGVQYVGVSVSTLVSLAVAPVTLTIAAAVQAKRRPATSSIVTVTCAVGGLALISLAAGSTGDTAPHPVWGIVASLGSGLGYAATTVLNRRLAAGGDALLLTAATSGIGAIVLLPVALPLGMGLSGDAVANSWLIYIGIVPTVLAYWFFYAGLRTTPSESAGVLTLLEPLTAAVLAAVLLDESLNAAGVVGAALLIAAIAALYLRKSEPEAAAL